MLADTTQQPNYRGILPMPDGSMPVRDGDLLSLSSISPKDKPWEAHRAEASIVQGYYAGTCNRYSERISQCSQQLGFALEAQDAGEFKLRLRLARFCRVRFCPTCQWRKSMMWRARFISALPRVQQAYPKHKYVFLTLTVRNVPLTSLRDTVKQMNTAWNRMAMRKAFPAVGYVKSLEVTRSAADEAHPHFHCLLMVPSSYFSHGYIKQSEWTELWKRSLKADYTPVVNVKAVKGKAGKDDLIAGVLETLKYSVKSSDLIKDAAWLNELTNQLHKSRAVSVGGILRQFISEEEPEDLIHAEDEEKPSDSDEDNLLYFGWREMEKIYRLMI
jgi:plasmid rolling circle replication initiator protein Rep